MQATLEDLPAQPYVLLPLQWGRGLGLGRNDPPDATALTEDHLLVEVRDAGGALVPGTLSYRQLPFTSELESYRPWWRPGALLEHEGRYSMRIVVPEPPLSPEYRDCPYTAFEATVELVVRAETFTQVAVVTSVDVEEVDTVFGYGACGQNGADHPCATPTSVCCSDPPLGRLFRVGATVEPMVGSPEFYLVSYEIRSPHVPPGASPFPFDLPLDADFSYLTRGTHGPLVPNEECARATITNLMDDSKLVSEWTCARPEDFTPTTPFQGCDPVMCREAASLVEPGEPDEPERSGGCVGGGVALWGVFALGLWARRRGV
ncbi:MAG TPA: hypothetical protein PK095_01320 [Myxococcota bacterium]|nr:hypothetical protein [Myxococcota bacterium]